MVSSSQYPAQRSRALLAVRRSELQQLNAEQRRVTDYVNEGRDDTHTGGDSNLYAVWSVRGVFRDKALKPPEWMRETRGFIFKWVSGGTGRLS